MNDARSPPGDSRTETGRPRSCRHLLAEHRGLRALLQEQDHPVGYHTLKTDFWEDLNTCRAFTFSASLSSLSVSDEQHKCCLCISRRKCAYPTSKGLLAVDAEWMGTSPGTCREDASLRESAWCLPLPKCTEQS